MTREGCRLCMSPDTKIDSIADAIRQRIVNGDFGTAARFDLYLQQQGLTPEETNIDEPSLTPAPADVAKAMGIAEGTSVVRRFRRQGTISTPYRLAENFYPVALAGGSILEQ